MTDYELHELASIGAMIGIAIALSIREPVLVMQIAFVSVAFGTVVAAMISVFSAAMKFSKNAESPQHERGE